MAYSAITNGEIDPDSPITTALMTKIRDNPEAIAEGLSGATRIVESALVAALAAKLVTNGNSHNHDGGDGAAIPAGGLASAAVTRAKLSTSTGSQAGTTSGTIDFLLSPYSYFPRVEAGGTSGTITMQGLSYSGTGTADTPGFAINVGGGSSENYGVYWRYVVG